MSDESFPDFTGRIVVVQLATPQVSFALEQARYERHLGKLYLIGRQVANPQHPHWSDGATFYIAPEQLSFFAVFDSLQAYLSRLAEFPSAPPPIEQDKRRRKWFGRGE